MKSTVLVLLLLLVSGGIFQMASGQLALLAYQVGAYGDKASRGNWGVQAQIRTHAYNIDTGPSNAAYTRADAFYLFTSLANRDGILFGYTIQPGPACLKESLIDGALSCTGREEVIPNGDPRWVLVYYLAGDAIAYGEIGPTRSAGLNGTWHTYTVMPASNETWAVLFDGNGIASINFKPWISESPVVVVADQEIDGALSYLGPVEYRNMSYLTPSGWHAAASLYASVGCAKDTPCTLPNPYGVSVVAPNHIIAGSGIQKHKDRELLWPQAPRSSTLDSLSLKVVLVAVIGLIILPVSIFLFRRRRRMPTVDRKIS